MQYFLNLRNPVKSTTVGYSSSHVNIHVHVLLKEKTRQAHRYFWPRSLSLSTSLITNFTLTHLHVLQVYNRLTTTAGTWSCAKSPSTWVHCRFLRVNVDLCSGQDARVWYTLNSHLHFSTSFVIPNKMFILFPWNSSNFLLLYQGWRETFFQKIMYTMMMQLTQVSLVGHLACFLLLWPECEVWQSSTAVSILLGQQWAYASQQRTTNTLAEVL